MTGLLETLQRPPAKYDAVVHFLLVEDESRVLQSTIFEDVYRRYGHVLRESGTYLLDGLVEHGKLRGMSYLTRSIYSLEDMLGAVKSSTSWAVATSPGTLGGSACVG